VWKMKHNLTVRAEHAADLQQLQENHYRNVLLCVKYVHNDLLCAVRAEHAADLQQLQENHLRELHKALTKSKVPVQAYPFLPGYRRTDFLYFCVSSRPHSGTFIRAMRSILKVFVVSSGLLL
jgi:hypothetical protein